MKRMIVITAAMGGIALAAYLIISGFSPNLRVINLVLKQDNKTYVYTSMDQSSVDYQQSTNQSPTSAPFLTFFEKGDNWYVQPKDLEPLVNLLTGMHDIFEIKEPSFDGYVGPRDASNYSIETRTRATETIGEQAMENHVTITSVSGSTKQISWYQILGTTNIQPMEGCELNSFKVQSSPHPGETVISSEDYIVVNVVEIAAFLNPSATLIYDDDSRLLTISK